MKICITNSRRPNCEKNVNSALNYCRNPGLHIAGDGCIVADPLGEVNTFQSCCLPPCSEDDQVPCMWSTAGNEYSGRIDRSCSRTKCIPWGRMLPKLRELLNIHEDDDQYHILDIFPDRSLNEASNFCRNPTGDICGPWCFTSMTSFTREACCVPDCEAANKGGNAEGTHDCIDESVLHIHKVSIVKLF